MKRRIIAIIVCAFLSGLLLPKQRLLFRAASKFDLDRHALENMIGPPAYSVRHGDAVRWLKLRSTKERLLLGAKAGTSYLDLCEELTSAPELERAVGYRTGDGVQWLLIDHSGQIRSRLTTPFLHDEGC